jgi:hypothetical protein
MPWWDARNVHSRRLWVSFPGNADSFLRARAFRRCEHRLAVSERRQCSCQLLGAWVFPQHRSGSGRRHCGLPVWVNLLWVFGTHTSDRRRGSSRGFVSNRRSPQLTLDTAQCDGSLSHESGDPRCGPQVHAREETSHPAPAGPRSRHLAKLRPRHRGRLAELFRDAEAALRPHV